MGLSAGNRANATISVFATPVRVKYKERGRIGRRKDPVSGDTINVLGWESLHEGNK